MPTKYPIILAHGLLTKQLRIMNTFGRISKHLEAEGYSVFIADTDGFGSIETNAEQLRRFVNRVLEQTGTEKVNIIAHSKGGLDSKYMITKLGMEGSVASLTTLCTPHRGSIIASKIWSLPSPMKKGIAYFIDGFFKHLCHDEYPNSMKACEQLRSVDEAEETIEISDKIYCQSYSTEISKSKDCFIMALPMKIQHKNNLPHNDGLVAEDSTRFGVYRGSCLDIPASHLQIIDIFSKKNQKEKIYAFYLNLADELSKMGF